ncbi:40605_t:CDS:1, partial [Gigaspora margarita]
MSFLQNLNIQNIFPPSLNNPHDIINMFTIHFNNQSVTAYGVFKMNVRREAERLGVEDHIEITIAESKLWNRATVANKTQYQTVALATNAILPNRFPIRT